MFQSSSSDIPDTQMQHAACSLPILYISELRCSMQHSVSFFCYLYQLFYASKHGQIFFRMQTMSNLHSMHSLHSSAILTNIKLIYFIRGNITDRYFSSCRQLNFSSSWYLESQKSNIIISPVHFNNNCGTEQIYIYSLYIDRVQRDGIKSQMSFNG